ncbi:MAG: hypothetical protein C4337_02565 [Armatimonadota bacterium]
MRAWIPVVATLGLAWSLTGCREKPLTEADLQHVITEHQERTNVEIERTIQSAPPPYAMPERDSGKPSHAKPNGASSPQSIPGLEIPPPNTYSPPPQKTEASPTPTPQVGDLKLDPQTGQYGIQPPGAPETYTIPLHSSPPEGQ